MECKLTLDVQERLRVEVRDNNFDFNSAINSSTDDTFLLQRFRLGLTARPCDRFSAYVQGQDAREIEGRRKLQAIFAKRIERLTHK
jgi:hypothetical protein